MSSHERRTPWQLVELLTEPTRREVYDVVRRAGRPTTREQAAHAAGISTRLAAFHLDRLAAAGLLSVDFAPVEGRQRGPGSGRPAKRYRAVGPELAVSVPARDYGWLAALLAQAIAERPGDAVGRAVELAREAGRARAASLGPRRPRSRSGTLAAAARLCEAGGYEPDRSRTGITMLNCPFAAAAGQARDVVCAVNAALIAGMIDGVDGDPEVEAALAPAEGRCCVVIG
ncbi:MAG: hypothetical protein QOK42_2038 [Frankiaceae bacterium]|nr:hypothetical protein [Frankiaceae bacterium]